MEQSQAKPSNMSERERDSAGEEKEEEEETQRTDMRK